jgi:hypothetical protein
VMRTGRWCGFKFNFGLKFGYLEFVLLVGEDIYISLYIDWIRFVMGGPRLCLGGRSPILQTTVQSLGLLWFMKVDGQSLVD